MSETCGGWRIVCPDGRVRHLPYHNEGDALFDAMLYGGGEHKYAISIEKHDGITRVYDILACSPYPDSPRDYFDPPCPQGKHIVEMIAFDHG